MAGERLGKRSQHPNSDSNSCSGLRSNPPNPYEHYIELKPMQTPRTLAPRTLDEMEEQWGILTQSDLNWLCGNAPKDHTWYSRRKRNESKHDWATRNKRAKLWHDIRSPTVRAFFNCCSHAAKEHDIRTLLRWFEEDGNTIPSILDYGDRFTREAIRVHLRCAELLAKKEYWLSCPNRAEVQWYFDDLSEKPPFPLGFLKDLTSEMWLFTTIGPISHEDQRARFGDRKADDQLRAPFALVDKSGQGKLVDFVFELIKRDGAGAVYPDPAQVFVPMDSDFRTLFDDVPQAVIGLRASDEQVFLSSDVRVRIVSRDTHDMLDTELVGNSATGAAAWGLHFLLSQPREVPDRGIIVMASVSDSYGNLGGVDKDTIPAKVQAVIDYNKSLPNDSLPSAAFDTIIVANADDKEEAERELKAHGKLGKIVVWNMADPKDVEQATVHA